ncbi:MAG: glycosyltransferase family 2 protein [Candidatus Bathyarchaeota archaeon]|jgi:dolichol-phosphate mannosyltransferase|nr:glycosyltransferase family 2 protein [Candidatus Bathyarchaeota archaeon]
MVELNPSISVVIATLNEEEGIGPTISELQQVLGNPYLVVVDGNSVDRTMEIAKNMGADVLLQEGKGKGAAMFQGFSPLCSKVQYIVFTDADYTYPAEYVPKMLEVLEQNPQVGMVIGNRFKGQHNHDKSVTNPFYVGNKLLAFAQFVMNGVKLDDPLSGLRIVRSEVLDGWKPKSKGFDVEAEMNAFVEKKGYKIVEVPIDYRDRLGEKKLKLRDGLGIMKRILVESLTF